ncbi:pilus assembly protein PilM [Vibrio rotiferianus]|jgi:type IV pilus assembly protein PilM|uniref:Pilus assembly protein PilM n=1 Tax=Vibrio rotiferianus TaxID=190895 RepID=A0ABX3D624_9VIBR|nr:type IV pilus assembly protein PilM [Vibrio rotiferianus]OHY91572.1 pilus assembly protein PilM [Vibrio rotiferianus]
MDKLTVAGIDISHNSLKAVILKPAKEGYSLLGYKEIVLNDAIVAENHTINHQEIVKTLKEIKKELPLLHRKAAASIPDSAVISKSLQLDSQLEESEVEFAIMQAFSLQSPFPIEELSLDFVPNCDSKGNEVAGFRVFATRKEVVESRKQAIEKAGLTPILLDVHSHSQGAIWQLATERHPEKAQYCLLYVGERNCSISMFTAQGEFFYKEFSSGLEQVINNLQTSLEENASEQEKVERFNHETADRVKRQLQLYSSMNGERDIRGIWLVGEGASTLMLAETLERQLQLDCELLNPFSLFEMKVPKRKRRNVDWQRFVTAAGIAIRAIDWQRGSHVASR